MMVDLIEKNCSDSVKAPMTSKWADGIGLKFIWRSLPRTILALAFALLLSAFMTAMQAVTDNRAIAAGLHRQADDPLPDLLMDWTGTSGAKFIPMYTADLFLNSLVAFTILCFLFSWRWRIQRYGPEEGHFRTLRIARKFLWMLGFAYLFRSFSLLSTTMPPTDPRCIYKHRDWKQISLMAVEIMTKQGNTCSDKIFSGHSSMATLVCLFWLGALVRPDRHPHTANATSVPLWRKVAAIGIVLWTSLVYIFCVLCRNHYSIDIIVAVLVCSGIFSTFQLSLKIVELDQLNALKLNNCSGDILALSNWASQHHYSPLQNDPEAALESPQIRMTEIGQVDEEFKPPVRLLHPHKEEAPAKKAAYVPPAFVLLLRAVAWMDGTDLRP